MKMINDMELNMVAGGMATAHGSGASGGWEEAEKYDVKIHGSGVSGGWGPSLAAPETEVPTNVVEVETETEVIIIMADTTQHCPWGPQPSGFLW